MARIWFKQQEQFDYKPLRAGLGYIPESQLPQNLCPKVFTTRLNQLHFDSVNPRLSPVYEVVHGDRYHAKAVDPAIKFKVERTYTLFLKQGAIWSSTPLKGVPDKYSTTWDYLNKDGYTFPELDLGFNGATWDMLVKTLLELNKKATIDSQFVVHVLVPWFYDKKSV